MKKERNDCYIELTDIRVIIATIISGVLAFITIFIASKNFWPLASNLTAKDTTAIIYACIVVIIMLASCITFIACIAILSTGFMLLKSYEVKQNASTAIIKGHLSSNNYSKITLYNIQDLEKIIKSDDLKCAAKLDENGNIQYNIKLDVTYTTDDYVNFVDRFYIHYIN